MQMNKPAICHGDDRRRDAPSRVASRSRAFREKPRVSSVGAGLKQSARRNLQITGGSTRGRRPPSRSSRAKSTSRPVTRRRRNIETRATINPGPSRPDKRFILFRGPRLGYYICRRRGKCRANGREDNGGASQLPD